MPPRDALPPAPDDLDPLEELVAACLEVEADKRPTAVESACRDHPEHAEGLRARIQVLEAMGMVPRAERAKCGWPERLGDFELIEPLGGGGMGVVYLALQTSLKREVALKLIRPEHLYFPGARERFRREVEAVARLQHPGIVSIYTVGETDDIPYFAMERVRGCTLAQALARLEGRAPETLRGRDLFEIVADAAGAGDARFEGGGYDGTWIEACLRLVRQVAEALQHAHERGILHRDVKPSNVLLTPDGRAMLLDFGLTSTLGDERATRTGSQVGTLHYMSPEHVRAGPIDPRADVYSLGVTLYELLTLQLPYRGEDALATQNQILAGRPDALHPRNRRVQPDLETVCLSAMERDPARRYAGAAAFARDLERVLLHRPIAARPPGPWLRAKRWAQRRPELATGLVLGTLLVTVLPSALLAQRELYAGRLARKNVALEREAKVSSQMTDFFLSLIHDAEELEAAGEALTSGRILEAGLQRAQQRYRDDPDRRARALMSLGIAFAGRQDLARAAEVLAEAEQAARAIDRADPSRLRILAVTLMKEAEALGAVGELEAGLEKVGETFELIAAHPLDIAEIRQNALLIRAELLFESGEVERSLELVREVLAEQERTREWPGAVAGTLGALGSKLYRLKRYDDALPLLLEAHAIESELEGIAPGDRIANLMGLGATLKGLGRLDEAEPYYLEAVELAGELWDADDLNLAAVTFNMARLQEARGDFEAAEPGLRHAARVVALTRDADDPLRLAFEARHGIVLAALGRWSEAGAILEEVVPGLRASSERARESLGPALTALGLVHRALTDPAAARAALEEGLELLEAASPDPGSPEAGWIERGQAALEGLE